VHLIIASSDLADALGWVARVLPARPAVPALAGIHLQVSDGRLRLAAFDLEQSAQITVDPEPNSREGVTVVSGRVFHDVVRALPKGPIEIALQGSRLRVQSKTGAFNLPVLITDDYPALPDMPPPAGQVDPHAFAAAVRRVAVATAREDAVPALQGIQILGDYAAGTLTMAATDRYRLAVTQMPFTPATAENFTVLIPGRALEGHVKAPDGNQPITLGIDGRTAVGVTSGARSATTRLLSAEFPKYQRLIPTEFAAEATVEVAALAAAVARVKLVSDHRAPCRLSFRSGEVLVEAGPTGTPRGSEDLSATASESVQAAYDGAPLTVAFNGDYLTDGLKTLGTPSAALRLTGPSRPAVLAPSGSAGNTDPFTYLLMPVRLSD
jgi:DNA polymerase-3 subunit beta